MSRVRISSAVGSVPRVSHRAQREVAAETVQQYARAAGAQIFETSARTGVGVAVRSLQLRVLPETECVWTHDVNASAQLLCRCLHSVGLHCISMDGTITV